MGETDLNLKILPNPGEFVKTEVIKPLGLSVTEIAKALGIIRQAMSSFFNQQTMLSAEMAIRLEKAFGISMETLMRMQNTYDIAQAKQRAGEIKVHRYVPNSGQQPKLF